MFFSGSYKFQIKKVNIITLKIRIFIMVNKIDFWVIS